jgi:hypothetical protein
MGVEEQPESVEHIIEKVGNDNLRKRELYLILHFFLFVLAAH